MLKKVLINLAKALMAVGLLWWLVQSGKLNWNLLAEMRRYPHRLMLAGAFCFFNLFLVTWRWRHLLSARASQKLPLLGLFSVNWIGMFFSSVLPGSVTGDVVKIFYVRKHDSSFSRAFLLFSCFLDRLMGLTGLIILMGLFSVANYGALVQMSPKLIPLLKFNFSLFGIVVTSLFIFFLYPKLINELFSQFKKLFPNLHLLNRLEDLWKDLLLAKPQIGWAIFISVMVQFFGVVIFHLLVSPQYVTELSLPLVLSFIPLGFMAVALPIAPGGLGVGHAAFETLFGFAGEPNGANFFNMYFVVVMAFNLLGAIPWLLNRKKSN
ncbi:MAG: flippase-like domain-containing protein [Bacteriovoracaceae bacterium]|nr:flippase-like domain-containing protein [Bacteriovoracaceae bacterium]